MPQSAKQRAEFLRAEIARHRDLYYNKEAEISDAEYDAMEKELEEIEAKNPELASDALKEVGAPTLSGFPPARHDPPMLSLDKVHDEEGLEKWMGRHSGPFQLWPKYDGVSLSLRYEKGRLVRAATRGDGAVGEDITDNVRSLVSGVPEKLEKDWSGEVRGEVLMPLADWKQYNKNNPDSPLANPRNATSGTLRAKDPKTVSDRKLRFYPYDLIDSAGSDILPLVRELGFSPEGQGQADGQEEALEFVRNLGEKRESLAYEVDGVVVRLASRADYEKAGYTGHHPRGAIAYKLPSEEGESELLRVVWQVGKSGIVAPVGEIRPVFLSGTTISRVSLHNLEIIEERDVRVGDRIKIKRAGDVIPHVIGRSGERSGKEKEIKPPTSCPSCKGPLMEEGESRILRCENTQGCEAQKLRRLEHWASRSAADIDAIGSKWIARMADAGLLRQPSDFYALSKEKLLEHFEGDGMKETLAEKMIASIESSKDIGLRKAIVGWSVPLASEGTAKRLCRAGYDSPEKIREASVDELTAVPDIGEVVAKSIYDFFHLPATDKEVEALQKAGVSLQALAEDGPVKSNSKLAGKKVVLTGTLTVSRAEFTALLEAAGASVSGSVSKNTDYLVLGKGGGSKKSKAESLGVAVLSEEEARGLL